MGLTRARAAKLFAARESVQQPLKSANIDDRVDKGHFCSESKIELVSKSLQGFVRLASNDTPSKEENLKTTTSAPIILSYRRWMKNKFREEKKRAAIAEKEEVSGVSSGPTFAPIARTPSVSAFTIEATAVIAILKDIARWHGDAVTEGMISSHGEAGQRTSQGLKSLPNCPINEPLTPPVPNVKKSSQKSNAWVSPPAADLQNILGHTFRDLHNLHQALPVLKTKGRVQTICTESTRRLALIGDKVLGLVLLRTHCKNTKMRIGDIATRCDVVWRNENLSRVGHLVGIHRYVYGGDEARRGKKAVADLVEALIGAVFQDSGIEAAAFVMQKLRLT